MRRSRLGGSRARAAPAVRLLPQGPSERRWLRSLGTELRPGSAPFPAPAGEPPGTGRRSHPRPGRGVGVGVCWGGVRKGGKGWGDGLLRRLPVVLAALKRDAEAGVPTAVLATAPPGNPIRALSALRFQNPSLISKLPPNFVQLSGARGLRGWGPPGTSPAPHPPTPGFSGSSSKFKFPLARFFLDPSTAPGL